jgi:N utilization substance protein B
MNREKIRENTMQAIFQMDATGDFDSAHLHPIEESSNALSKAQAVTTLDAVRDHIEEIDAVIRHSLDKWSFERVAKTDLAILRTAVAEMMYIDSIPDRVSINEAVNLAKKYGDEKSYAFVNSVLSKADKLIKQQKAADQE